MTKKILLIPIILLYISTISVIYCQDQTLKLNPKTFNMTINGTSSLHDFQSKVTLASGELVFVNGKAQSMSVEIPVKGIKSKEKLMDTKTYEAFNSDKNPMISFKLNDASSLQINGSDISVSAIGNLTMNGTTRKVTLKANGKIVKPGIYQFTGNYKLKMTDYKMTPPTMLVIKVGDEITLKYDVTFEGAPTNQ